MFDPQSLVRSHIKEMPAYEPILPFEVLSRQLGRQPKEIIKLDANENPYGLLPAVREALAAMPYAHIYPDPGSGELRQAISEAHSVPVENLLAGAGADELIDLVLRLVIEPGDVILNCPPTFGMYRFDGDLNGAQVVEIYRREDFSLDVEAIEQAARLHKPKVLFLASPNNPDGSLLPGEVIERLLELPLLLVLDEAYIEFAPPGSSQLAGAAQAHNLIVLRTFSKWAGLAGLRVGYGAFPSALIPHLWKIKQPYNVSVAASTAAVVSLQHKEELDETGKRLTAERQRLFRLLEGVTYLHPYPSQANFILCRVEGRDARQLKLDLQQAGVLVRYFNKPGLDNCIRISVGRPEHTERLLAALLRIGLGPGVSRDPSPRSTF
jgi:histidinol-phosphate aminotransferase